MIGAASMFSAVGYFGIIKPIRSNSQPEILKGALAPMDKRKNGMYATAKDHYYVHEFNQYSQDPNKRFNSNDTPSLSPSLKLAYLDNSTKLDYLYNFSEPIQNLVKQEASQSANFLSVWSLSGATVLARAQKLKRFLDEFSTLSDREITYRSMYFMLKLNSLSFEQLGSDILWSLAEESISNKLIIRPESISIDMTLSDPEDKLVKHTENFDKWLEQAQNIPVSAKKVSNFKLSFTIFNPHKTLGYILRSIPVEPLTESTVTITLPYSELRPFTSPIRAMGYKSITWGLIPEANNQFEVNIETSYPYAEYKTFFKPKLNLIHGRSKYFDEILSEKDSADLDFMHVVNIPTYRDLKEVITPFLSNISLEDVKKDIESWYGSIYARSIRMKIDDLIALINILKKEIFVNPDGNKVSFLTNLVENVSWRNNFYTRTKLKKPYGHVISTFFDKNSKHVVSAEDMHLFLTSAQHYFKKIVEKITVEFTWEKQPTFVAPRLDFSTVFPTLNFSFKQKITWDEDIKLVFKGCFEENKENFDENTTDEKSCSSPKKWFDISGKLNELKAILTPAMSAIGGEVLGINIFDALIPDASKFVGWDELEIKKNESIEIIYKAINSPIVPAVTSNYDVKDENGQFALLGWKALDVAVEYNLSNFTNLFEKIYSKIDVYEDSNKYTSISLMSYSSEIKKNPISFLALMVNRLFKQQSKQQESPWKSFFKSLLSTKINLGSTQLFSGYSRAFFNVPSWVEQEGQENTQEKKFKTKIKWEEGSHKSEITNRFPATAKTKEIEMLVKKLHVNYSTFFPYAPLVFDFTNDKEYNEFLEKEAKSSDGFLHSINRLKGVLQNSFHSKQEFKDFPSTKYIDWEKIKISFYRFEFVKAFKSVLAMYSTDSMTSILLSVGNVNVPNLLGAAMERDSFLVTVNMLMENGSLSLFSDPIDFSFIKPESVYNFTIGFKIDPQKLELGNYAPK